jgi:hypothetical protein
MEALDVDHAGAELAPLPSVLADQVELRHLAPGELQHELVGPGLEECGEVRPVRPVEPGAAEAVAEADVEGELGADPLGRQVEQAGHLLAAHVAPRRLVDLDEDGAGVDQSPELLVDDLREALGHLDDALVEGAGVDARAEGERAGAGGLDRVGRVGLEVRELLDDAEPAVRGLDPADRLVARLLVVAPGAELPAHLDRPDPLDDRVVGVDVAVEAADLPVGDHVDARPLHVPDRRVGRVVEHLVEVGGAQLAGLPGPDAQVPPAGASVRTDDGGGDQRQLRGHRPGLL